MSKKKNERPDFVLKAHDNLAVQVVELWIQLAAVDLRVPKAKLDKARAHLERIKEWRAANPGLCKWPD